MHDTLSLLTSEPASEQEQWFFCSSPHLTCRFTAVSCLTTPTQYRRSTGVALFCEGCCGIWARIGPIDTHDLAKWVVVPRPCHTHGNGMLTWSSYAPSTPLSILFHDFKIASECDVSDTRSVWHFDVVNMLLNGLKEKERFDSVRAQA